MTRPLALVAVLALTGSALARAPAQPEPRPQAQPQREASPLAEVRSVHARLREAGREDDARRLGEMLERAMMMELTFRERRAAVEAAARRARELREAGRADAAESAQQEAHELEERAVATRREYDEHLERATRTARELNASFEGREPRDRHEPADERAAHVRQAVEHLHAAGLHDLAELVAREAGQAQREHADERPEARALHQVHRMMDQMREQMHRLAEQVQQLSKEVELIRRRPRE